MKFPHLLLPEVVREVGINDFRVAAKQQRFHLDHRLLGIAPRTIGILLEGGRHGQPRLGTVQQFAALFDHLVGAAPLTAIA